MKHHLFIALCGVIILTLPLLAEKVNHSEAERVVLTHLAGEQMTWDYQLKQGLSSHAIADYTIRGINPVTDEESGDTLFYVAHLWPEGFIVVSTDTSLQPIIAYSYYGSFPIDNTPRNRLLWMLQWDMKLRAAALSTADERSKTVNTRNWAALLNNPPEVQTVEQWPPVEHFQYNKGWLPVGELPLAATPMAHIDHYWQTVFPFSPPVFRVDIVDELKKIRRYNTPGLVIKSSSPMFFNKLTENMRRGWPARLEIQPDKVEGSLFVVADGYRLTVLGDSYYHLDFGGRSGIPAVWYAFPQRMPAGFTIVNAALLDIHPTDDIYEPNNTLPEAYPIMDSDFNRSSGLWKTQSHTAMQAENDRDWYRFEARIGDELTVTSRAASGGYIEVSLYKGTQLIETGEGSPNSVEIELSHQVSVPGTYFVAVGRDAETPVEEVVNYGLQIERFRETLGESKAPEKTLESLHISGPSSVDENDSADYTAAAYFDDETSQDVSIYATWSENSIYASMLGYTLETSSVSSNQTVTISASYNSGGVYKTAYKTVTIVNVALDYITVSGPTSLMENTSANYNATAYFTNGTNNNVTASASWSENSAYATMSGNTLNAGTVSSHQAVRVTASYTNGGITRSDYIDVTIVNFELASVVVDGPNFVNENSIAIYNAYAFFTDDSYQDVTYSASYFAEVLYASMSGNVLITYSVPQNIHGSVWVTYTYNGVTKSDITPVVILDIW